MQRSYETTFSLKQAPRTDPVPQYISNGSGRDGIHKLKENFIGVVQPPPFKEMLRDYDSDSQKLVGVLVQTPPTPLSNDQRKTRQMQKDSAEKLAAPRYKREKAQPKDKTNGSGVPYKSC